MLISQLISLYQMLLFNCVFVAYVNTICDFNTSNVTIQHTKAMQMPRADGYFNTSNVTIQRSGVCEYGCRNIISIHLMLLFNITNTVIAYKRINFNTSNVTIQPISLAFCSEWTCHFNTSNVTIQRS